METIGEHGAETKNRNVGRAEVPESPVLRPARSDRRHGDNCRTCAGLHQAPGGLGPAHELIVDDRDDEIDPEVPAKHHDPLDEIGRLGRWHEGKVITQVGPGAFGVRIAHDDMDSGITGRPQSLEGRDCGRRAGTSDENTESHEE